MGNIEIRQEKPHPKRTSIFADKKSLTPTKNSIRKSFTTKNEREYMYSPIRYTNKNKIFDQNILTERKANSTLINTSRQINTQRLLNEAIQYEPFSQEPQSDDQRANEQKHEKYQRQNGQEIQQLPNAIKFQGKIVSNSGRRNINNNKFALNQNIKAIQHSNRTSALIQPNNQNARYYDPLENRQIIKKVRNFNDFLIEIKKKLKQNKRQSLNRRDNNEKNSDRYSFSTFEQKNDFDSQFTVKSPRQRIKPDEEGVFNAIEKSKSMRKIEVALKLENQKLQLEKYRRLVERELSKTRSIESISISTKNAGEKVLTIQYEALEEYKTQNKVSHQLMHQRDSSQITIIRNLTEMEKIKTIEKPKKIIQIQSNFQNLQLTSSKKKEEVNQNSQIVLFKKLRQQYEKTMRNMIQLGKTIQTYENKITVDRESFKKPVQIDLDIGRTEKQNVKMNMGHKPSAAKLQLIQGLFKKLSLIQEQYHQTDKQIRKTIEQSQNNTLSEENSSQILQFDGSNL